MAAEQRVAADRAHEPPMLAIGVYGVEIRRSNGAKVAR